jgi:drug/metabolite transporter (DMT)-like permease
VNPVVAAVVGWALLDETITPRAIVSGVLVLVGVVLIVTASQTSPRVPARADVQ